MFAMNVRKAKTDDLPLLIAFDRNAHTDIVRQQEIKSAIVSGGCWVFAAEGRPVAYAILDQNFFGHPRVRSLFVSPEARRKGAASLLIRHMETVCGKDRVFIGCPSGNNEMINLLNKLDYQCCGEIRGVSDFDTELVFIKHLAANQNPRAAESMPLFAAQ